MLVLLPAGQLQAQAAAPGRAPGMAQGMTPSIAPPAPSAAGAGRAGEEEVAALRRERQALEAQMALLQRTARSLSDDLGLLEAQREATARVLEALDRQLADINDEVARTEQALARTEAELAAKRAVLQRRLVAVYKRGGLREGEALLSAQSFAGLVARYRYLREAAAHDRELVRRVEGLRSGAMRQRRALETLRGAVQRTRQEKDLEGRRLAQLEERRSQSLTAVARSTERARERLARLGGGVDVAGGAATGGGGPVTVPVPELPVRRRGDAPARLASTDRGRLEWPVPGGVLYPFGRTPGRDNVTLRWNGLGIRAPMGTPVRTVAGGEVAVAGPVGTYGPTVIVKHGGEDYTVYGSLGRIMVRRGQAVERGEVIGTVGASDPALPAHLHFELRPKGRAVDPLPWLRRPAGGPG